MAIGGWATGCCWQASWLGSWLGTAGLRSVWVAAGQLIPKLSLSLGRCRQGDGKRITTALPRPAPAPAQLLQQLLGTEA